MNIADMAYSLGYEQFPSLPKALETATKNDNGNHRFDAWHCWQKPFADLAAVRNR